MTVQQLYEEAIRALSIPERLQLANRLLTDVVDRGPNYSEEWTDEDLAEFTTSGWHALHRRLDEEEAHDAAPR